MAKAKSPKKKNHLTEVLNAVTVKTPCEYNPKEVSAYVVSLFLSEDQKLCEIVNEINPYLFSLTDEGKRVYDVELMHDILKDHIESIVEHEKHYN